MRRIITYGTFDLFHQGHYNILKRAKEQGDYLIVGITGESYDMERGKLSVKDSLVTRIENVQATGFADQIIIEEYLGQKIHDIIEYNVDALVIGSDWKGKFDHLRKYCEVIYLERTKDISSTLLRESGSILKLGLVIDSLEDSNAILESKYVSGIHCESVFSEDPEIAFQIRSNFELDKESSNFELFLSEVDIVYVKCTRDKRYQYVKQALMAKKHVICDPVISLDSLQVEELFSLAKKNSAILLENIPTLYLQAFNQLLWNARGNLIGDIISIKCSINKERLALDKNFDIIDCLSLPIHVLNKIVGSNHDIQLKCVRNEDQLAYLLLTDVGTQQKASFTVEVGIGIELENDMEIIGGEGRIVVPADWWETGYFKIKRNDEEKYKRYSSNYDGNGFRYLLQSLLSMIDDQRVQTSRVFPKESAAVSKILSRLEKQIYA